MGFAVVRNPAKPSYIDQTHVSEFVNSGTYFGAVHIGCLFLLI